MNKDVYMQKLEKALIEKNKDETYINECLKYAKRLLNNDLPVIFDTKHLSLLLGVELAELYKIIYAEDLYYKEVNIPKKSGGLRQLFVPSVSLKYIQRWILDSILINIKISEYANGFCKNKSIVTNAIKHVNKDCIINIDLKDFFPSIKRDNIFMIFYYYGYTKEVSFVLSKLCTYQNKLPQGSPASPYLSNIVCLKMDKRISNLAIKYEADYTRYADDITISGNYGIEKIIDIIKNITREEDFTINDKKTRIAYRYERQEVTGLIVSQGKIAVNRKYKRILKQEIYYCLKYGVLDHLSHIKCEKSFYKEHLYGKAYFINMVEPKLGQELLKELDSIKWEY